MATHLGRNPFNKKAPRQKLAAEPSGDDSQSERFRSKKSLGERLLVDLPVGSFMFALKSVLLLKGRRER